jgi:hypothetical protein
MNEFFTWQQLVTFAGAMAATGIITQFVKGLVDKVVHIPTQALAYAVALIVLYAAHFFTGTLDGPTAAISLFNAILIATATSGTVDAVKRVEK